MERAGRDSLWGKGESYGRGSIIITGQVFTIWDGGENGAHPAWNPHPPCSLLPQLHITGQADVESPRHPFPQQRPTRRPPMDVQTYLLAAKEVGSLLRSRSEALDFSDKGPMPSEMTPSSGWL